jgi:hypothetical protein
MLLYVPGTVPRNRHSEPKPFSSGKIYYYKFQPATSAAPLPRIASTGPGAHPGVGFQPSHPPRLGSTARHANLTIVSKPLYPDNLRQTIYQPSSPPDLRISTELKLPNIVPRSLPEIEKPLPELHLRDLKPLPPKSRIDSAAPSSVPAIPASPSLVGEIANAQPRLPITSLAAPRNGRMDSVPASPAPTISTDPLLVPQVGNVQPRLPITSLAAPRKLGDSSGRMDSAPASPTATISTDPLLVPQVGNVQPRLPITGLAAPRKLRGGQDSEALADADRLLIIGVEPSGELAQLILPDGHRLGEFSVSPAGGRPGSPGGSLDVAISGGSGGSGPGGDESTGVGVGHDGGGGGSTASAGRITVAGSAITRNAPLGLDPVGAARMVYPVPSATLPRRNALVVSVGPRGGGGLQVYGALPCGKIYTVFLPMPGGAWTLQFCRTEEGTGSDARSSTIHLEPTLVPPDPELKFDFQRLPVPPEKAHKMIVLKGVLRDDGTVDKLQVYQGVAPQMDEAARIAFSRWTFKPAMLGGNPSRIEILVGIPLGTAEAR